MAVTRATLPRPLLLEPTPPRTLTSTPLPACEVDMQCPSPKCGSSNVQLLSHYVDSLPPGSPLKTRYARPSLPEGGFVGALAAVVVGVVMLLSGGILGGLLVLGGGLLWGWVLWGRHAEADSARAAWSNQRICLACTEKWVP